MSKNTGLGRGFDSLIPINFAVDEVVAPGEHIKNMDIAKIVANPEQPRKEFDQVSLFELSESIKQHGVIQPLVVTPYNDSFRIVAGERRFRASQLAGLTKVPVVVRNHAELEELEIALVENVQRVDLSPLEQAVSIVRLHDQFSMSFKDIARKLGKAETTISNIVRLLQLPEPALKALRENKITEGHARAILALKTDEKRQTELLNKIIVQGISVRQAEAYVQASKIADRPKLAQKITNQKTILLLTSIDPKLAKKITVKEKTDTTGIITIKYSSAEELTNFVKKLDS